MGKKLSKSEREMIERERDLIQQATKNVVEIFNEGYWLGRKCAKEIYEGKNEN